MKSTNFIRLLSKHIKCVLFILFIVFSQTSFSQIVINEINVKPNPDPLDACAQSLKNCTSTTCGSEYVEFYNNSDCPVDISCYIFVTESFDGPRDGAFRFPSGTIIPPRGFTSIGGANSGATFNLATFCADNHMLTNSSRWYLDNGDAWVALYTDTGTLIDAVFWTAGANQSTKWPADSDLDDVPSYIPVATSSSCPVVNSLSRPTNTVGTAVNQIEYAGVNPTLGMVLERTTDGQNTWAIGASTLNSCNGVCVQAATFSSNATVQQPGCGLSNGSIAFSPQPSGTYTYTWVPNVSATSSAAALPAGSYTVTIAVAPGCQIDTTIVLVSTGGITSANAVVTNASCGLQDGQIQIQDILGGTAPYQVNFNGLGFSNNLVYTNLASGIYSIVLKDASGCQFNLLNQTVGNGGGPTAANSAIVNTTCGLNNGQITISNIQNGVGPYEFSLNNGSFTSNTVFSGLSQGNYTITIKDANGCQFFLNNLGVLGSSSPTQANVQVQQPSCGALDGAVSVTNIVGGSAPYTLNFNNQGFGNVFSFNGLGAGDYGIVLRDANGCDLVLTNALLTSANGPQDITLVVNNSNCSQSNGSIEVLNTIGGNAPYTYSLNGNPYTTQKLYGNLASGNYSVSVMDGNGCVFVENVVVQGGNGPTANFKFSPNELSTGNSTLNLFDLSSNDVVAYNWLLPGCLPATSPVENPVVSVLNLNSNSILVTLIVTNVNGCTDTISKLIPIKNDFNFYAPNCFTPDGDEYNNEWNVFLSNVDLTSYHLILFDRWGEVVFESFDPKIGWDGVYHGEISKEGVYIWKVSFKELNNDKKHEFEGHLLLIR